MFKKVSIPSAGGYEKLQILQEQDLRPQRDQVVINVQYAGINYADILVRLGVYESAKRYVGFPITPGFEVSGTVKSIGPEVKNFRVGDKVIGFTLFNGYSGQIAVTERQVMPLPAHLSLEQAAAFPAVYMTAFYALQQIVRVYPGSKILVHSVAGGVGTALTQLGKAMGLKVYGVVGNKNKIEYAKSIGVDYVYDKSDPGFQWDQIAKDAGDGFDLVFDANGFVTFQKSYDLLRPTGKLVIYGAHGLIPKSGGKLNYLKAGWGLLKTPRFNPMKMITDNKSVICFNLSFLFNEIRMIDENIQGLNALLQKGLLGAPQVKVFPVEKVAEAHQHMESGLSVGKLVLKF